MSWLSIASKTNVSFCTMNFQLGFLVLCFTGSAGRLQAQLSHFTMHYHTLGGVRPRVLKMGVFDSVLESVTVLGWAAGCDWRKRPSGLFNWRLKDVGPVLCYLLFSLAHLIQITAPWDMNTISIQLRRIPGKGCLVVVCHIHDDK